MERTCSVCPEPTWIIWDGRAWCRRDFLEAVERAEAAAASTGAATSDLD